MDNRSDIWRGVDTIKPRFVALADRVWAMPEVCYTEARSSAEHLAELPRPRPAAMAMAAAIICLAPPLCLPPPP